MAVYLVLEFKFCGILPLPYLLCFLLETGVQGCQSTAGLRLQLRLYNTQTTRAITVKCKKKMYRKKLRVASYNYALHCHTHWLKFF